MCSAAILSFLFSDHGNPKMWSTQNLHDAADYNYNN